MSKNNCTYRFTGPDGKEQTIQGMAAMKAFLADGGLEFFYPDGKFPWLKTEAAQVGAKSGTKSGNITDFGEKIGGAKKDLWTGFKDDLAAVPDDDIASQPLSKVWPAPDYQALIESGTSPDVVAFIRAARDEIPAKPRVGYKVKGWASKVKTLRGLALDMISGKTTMKDVQAQMEKAGAISSSMQGFMGRVELYQAFGHGKSLEGIRMSWQHYTLYRGQQNVSMWVVEQDAKATAWSNFPRELATGKTKEEAIESFRKAYEKLGADKEAKKGVQFDIIHYRGQDGYWISKKLGRNHVKVHGPLATVKEAREYRDQHQAELVAKLEKIKEIPNERRDTNEPRVGEDMRNGADVTPELFGQTFGFRGVEFGNWVEQGRRQRDLNDAFDALMDMAAILGIPPRAISLNGQLGLAFGARGTGGSGMVAAAHYEPDKVVINLTKKSGAGSLGHEWWHAVDNYFAKMRREQGGSFMTTSRDVLLASRGSGYVPYAGVRPEMIKAFGDVVKAINLTGMKQRAAVLDGKRSKEYWATGEEMSARAYEAYLINKLQDQNVSNDYLANIVSEESWNAAAALGLENENSYPYPLSKEVPGIRAAFDNFFQTVQTREDDNGNVALFSVAPDEDAARFSFAGQGAKTADTFQLETAQKRLKAGESAERVRRETGWHMGVDGKWRFEIADDDAKLSINETGDTLGKAMTGSQQWSAGDLLGNLLDHPKLFAAYPSLRSMFVNIRPADRMDGARGSYSPSGDSITLSDKLTREEALSVLLHEVQHAIQHREGFATGGAPDAEFSKSVKAALNRLDGREREAVEQWKWANSGKLDAAERASRAARYALMYESAQRLMSYANREAPSGVFRLIRNEMQWIYGEEFRGNDEARELQRAFYDMPKSGIRRNRHIRDMAERASNLLRGSIPAELLAEFRGDDRTTKSMVAALQRQSERARRELAPLRELEKQARNAEGVKEAHAYSTPFEVYQALAGEVEARNTQTRQAMTDAERRDKSPLMTADVPAEKIVVMFGGLDIQAPRIMASSDLTASVEVASPAGSISEVELDSVVKGALNGWKAVGGDMIATVQSASDLPAEIVQGAKDQGLDLSKVEGVQHQGKVYLVRDNLRGADHAQRVLFHEVLGHLGVKGALSGKTKETMRALWAKLGGLKGVEAMARKIDAGDGKTVWDRLQPYTKGGALTMDRQAIIMDELIAYIAQSNDQRPLIRFRAYLSNLKADVVSLLRKLGLNTLADRLDKAGAELDVLALVRDARKAIETGKTRDGQSFTFTTNPGRPSFSQRTSSGNQIPDAIIGHKLGDLNRHPDYAAAKGGDVEAAFRIATDMVDDAMVEKVRAAAGGADIIVPVVSVEASGRNKIPLAVAQVLADKLGNKANAEIIQVNSPKRTAMDGLDRLLSPPVFDGPVEAGAAYVMVDDALTQGGTFASMASHIIDNGGRVAGAVALTGKQYSAKLSPSPELLSQVRDRYQSVEAQFRAATGYGFDALTESEARYLAKHDNAQLVRDRITEAGDAARQRATQGNDRGSQGLTDLGGADTRFSVASSGQPSSWASPAESAFDNLIYKMQDKNIDAKRVVESITKTVGAIKDSLNVYLQEELFHGRAAKRVADFGARELTPMLNQMRMANLSMDEVEEFLHARHAKEANAVIAQRNPGNADMQDGGSGMTNAEADAYFAKLPAAQRAKLEAVAKRVDAIIADTRKLYVDYGLEDQAVVDGWTGMFKHYIPLMRENKDGGMGIGQGFSVKGKEVKGRTGSKRKVVDIIANIAAQREKVIVRGEKNRVSQALVGLAWANPNKGFWEVRSQAPTERVYDEKTGKVVDRPDPMFKSRDNVLGAKVKDSKGNVTEQFVVFNEDDPRAVRMAAALKNLDAGNLEGLLGVSAKITRYFSAINTQYNPVFGVVNLVRDVQGAMVNLAATPLAGQQAKIAKDTASALAGIYGDIRKTRKGGQATSQWAKLWEQMQEDGGTTGYRDLFKTSADRAESLKSIINPDAWMDSKWGKVFTADGRLKVPMSYAKKHAGALFDWLSDYNEAMENGVRLAAYKAALDKGMSREQAASLAKNLTVNFNRKGQVGQQAGAVYAFFNAAMQGTARIGQTLFDMDGGNIKTLRLSKVGKTVVYGGVLLGAMQALALAGAGFDENDPPEFVRERSLIIPTGGKTYFTIPMPLGLHVIPGLGRHAVEFALSGFDKPAQRAVSVMGMFVDAFNPIGNAGMSLQTIAPTAIDPLVALSENKDWTGNPIARTSFNPALPGHTQWKDSATGISKFIAEAINWISGGNEYVAGAFSPTPDQIDYLIAQVGGGVAREASKIMQSASSLMTGEELPAHKIPLLGRFYGNAEGQASQGNAFYANLNKLNELETQIKGMRSDGKYADVAQLMRDRPESALIAAANKAERDVQKLRRDKRDLIERGADRAEVKAKEDQITSVMVRLNELVKSREEVDQ